MYYRKRKEGKVHPTAPEKYARLPFEGENVKYKSGRKG
jgi:hypothetical protein